jgi:hypothetical protein
MQLITNTLNILLFFIDNISSKYKQDSNFSIATKTKTFITFTVEILNT